MKKYILIFSTVVLAISCKDMLNTRPADEIVSDSMWLSEALCEQGIYGLYKNFNVNTGTSSHLYEQCGWFYRNVFEEMEFQTSFVGSSFNPLEGLTKSASTGEIGQCWSWAYTGVHRCNEAIANLYKGGLSESVYEEYLCEAMFLRAWYYSYLNKVFHGVPIYLEPVSNSDCTKAESTSAEVWDLVVEDLTYCIENEYFPDNTLSASNYGRASKGAAYSLRGMAYMWIAWENGDDSSYYRLAAADFEKVAECGYALWDGEYIDFFKAESEKSAEMIFPVQYSSTSGFTDNFQKVVAASDCYNGWNEVRPSYDFVGYYQNADGSKFDWAERIPEWNDDVFLGDVSKREVFFMRDSISLDSSDAAIRNYTDDAGNVIVSNYWDIAGRGTLNERIGIIGVDVFKKYYLKDANDGRTESNEDRIRRCFENRDPRLKQTVLTPYDPYEVYSSEYNSATEVTKEMRWPYVRNTNMDGGDIYINTSPIQMYLYKKYVCNKQGQIASRDECQTDWPLIRYTDVYLLLAECYVHTGNLSGAVDIVNEIRSRAGMPAVSVGTSDEVMEAVRYERRVELCMEGQDWFDEWRWGTYRDMKFQGLDTYGPSTMWGEWQRVSREWNYNDHMYPWPIPASECEKNHNLSQTPNWLY